MRLAKSLPLLAVLVAGCAAVIGSEPVAAGSDLVGITGTETDAKKNTVGSLGSGGAGNGAYVPPVSNTVGGSGATLTGSQRAAKETDAGNAGNSNAFLMSVSMIIVSEIGDKTFLIAALMAMKANRVVVFSAAFAALAIMTILSGIVGHTLPALIPQRLTQLLAGVLFVIFGYKLLREGLAMSKDVGVDEEMAEVEEEIAMSDINQRMDQTETGGADAAKYSTTDSLMKLLQSAKELFSFVLSPLFVQVFVMTFLGEWGDRSQIATIAMAAGSDYWLVIAGAVIGHGICTGGAVLGGKLLATRISMRNVTLGGSAAFFLFAILYFYDAINGDHEA